MLLKSNYPGPMTILVPGVIQTTLAPGENTVNCSQEVAESIVKDHGGFVELVEEAPKVEKVKKESPKELKK